ncbi:DUF427 domain-containing protein [Chloroflexota bacterium]
MKAVWNGTVLAESDETVMVEGNHYFPPESINHEFFKESSRHTVCPWKGQASYYHIAINGDTNQDAAWTYRSPRPAAEEIKDYVAFWGGVRVEN